MVRHLMSGAGGMLETVGGPLKGALNKATGSGTTAVNVTEADGLRVDDAGAGALTGPGDVLGADRGSGDGVGGVGEEEALTASTDARGGKDRRARCSSTTCAGT